jgi:hypothetical protein
MRTRLSLLAVLILAVGSAMADTIPPGDPEVAVGGGGLSGPVGNTFSFNVPGDTSPCATKTGFQCFAAFNNSGINWTNLAIFFPSGTTGITCSVLTPTPLFSACTVNFNEVLFTGGTGISAGTHFDIAVNANLSLGAQANVPEPATVSLFLTGLGAMIARRRLRKV